MRPDDKIKFYMRNTRGKSISIQGAISNKSPNFRWATSAKNNTESFKAFIDKKIKNWPAQPRKTILVLDNASYHKGRAIKDHINKLGLSICYLPVSSSELNPIGR